MNELHRRNSGKLVRVFISLGQLALLLPVLLLLALYFFAVPLGLELFFLGNLSTKYSPSSSITVLFFYTHIEVNLGVTFAFLLLVYVLCFVLAWKQTSILHKVYASFPKTVNSYLKRSLFILPVLSSLTYVAVRAIHFLEESQGIPVGKPPLPKDTLLRFFELSVYPITEEIVYRVLPIGVFLIVRLLSLAKEKESLMVWREQLKFSLLALISPKDAKKKLGLETVDDSGFWKGITRDEWMMILFTSVFFALSHYLSTGTWEVGKISSTFIQGLVMGLSYLVYGVQAPILLHWYFNYYFYTYGLAAIIHPNLRVLNYLNENLTLVLGIFGLLIVAYSGMRRVAETHVFSFETLFRSAEKLKDSFIAKGKPLLTFLHRLDLFDLAALALTLIIFSIRLSIVNSPSPKAGEKYYETGFVFDESYYVKAARKMLIGESTNNEHPPLLKAFIMLGIVLFGDNPFGWRIFPVITSSISIALVYGLTFLLTRKKSASFSAALLFAIDIMAFNIGQIGMLDAPSMMFVLAASISALKKRYDLGGLLLGFAVLCKLSSVFAAAGVILFLVSASLVKSKNSKFLRDQVQSIGRVFLIALVTFLVGLWIYDAAYNAFSNNPLNQLNYMWTYHNRLRYQNPEDVILPLQWINPFNTFSPVEYHVATVREISNGGKIQEYHPIAYYGIYTPLWWSIWVVMPISLVDIIRRVHKSKEEDIDLFVFSWVATNFFSYVLLAYLMQRWVYPFYFYLSLPGLYAGLSHYLAHSKPTKTFLAILTIIQLFWFIVWFPVKPKVLIDLLLSLGLPT